MKQNAKGIKKTITNVSRCCHNFILYMLVLIAFTSCNDGKLAKGLTGSWTSRYTTTRSDGTKEKVTEKLTFVYDGSDVDSDGTFTEELTGYYTGIETDEYNLEFTYHSRIKGKYEVIAGDLYLYYKMSTLTVDIPPEDFKIKYTNYDLSDFMDDFADAFRKSIFGGEIKDPKKELIKVYKKECYSLLFQGYNSGDEDSCYSDLEVSDTYMSFETADLGTMRFKRVSK
jgi:hypothetical protein